MNTEHATSKGDHARMDSMWGERTACAADAKAARVALFRDGNYGMFIHFGLYSHLAGAWLGMKFHGIGEWIKHELKISDDEYMAIAREFNPNRFDAAQIVATARRAGMRWIIVTSKHHDGFAMFKSAHPFNIVDATPFARDLMQELAGECRSAGLGFGFYYSHYQDWTEPGGGGKTAWNQDKLPASFEDYFRAKCYPQIEEICTQYGPLDFVWFDTPGNMPKEPVMQLADLVRRLQPNALVCSRIGHGMGDYVTLGDMEVPPRNVDGLWETCDTTNDSWGFVGHDKNWKGPREILHRLVATVARGGAYLLNVGPDATGRIPEACESFLLACGDWIHAHPDVIYQAGPSPWGMAFPWGDATSAATALALVIFDVPRDGKIWLPGLKSEPLSVELRLRDGSTHPLNWLRRGDWLIIELKACHDRLDPLANVVRLHFDDQPAVEQVLGLHPNLSTTLLGVCASRQGLTLKRSSWMEKFGEWKHVDHLTDWGASNAASWRIDVAQAGYYQVMLKYSGSGRLKWRVQLDDGESVENEQSSTPLDALYPLGMLNFNRTGMRQLNLHLDSPCAPETKLHSIVLTPAWLA